MLRPIRDDHVFASTPSPREFRAIAYPTSDGQRAFLVAHERFCTVSTLNTGVALTLRGALDEAALRAALEALWWRHPVLREAFEADDPTHAKVRAEPPPPLGYIDLSALDVGARPAALLEIEGREIGWRFDLASDPLLRATLVRLDAEHHVLLLVNHHITGDGTSFFGVYLRELAALYTAAAEGGPYPLPSQTAGFDDYVRLETERNQGRRLERASAFWRETLRDAPASIELPTDRTLPPAFTGAADRVPSQRRPGLLFDVRERARAWSVTPLSVLLAAFGVLLHRLSSQRDLVVGLPVANRGRPEFADVYGPFMNTLPLRLALAPESSFRAFASSIAASTFRAMAWADITTSRIVDAVAPAATRSRNPLYQTCFNFMDFVAQDPVLPGLETQVERLTSPGSLIELLFEVEAHGDDLSVAVNFSTQLYERATIEAWVERYLHILEAGLREPERSIATLPWLSPAELAEGAIAPGPVTPRPAGDEVRVDGLVLAAARRTPDAIAVIASDRRLTYAELVADAYRLAEHLGDRGVGRDSRVGIHVGRTSYLVVSVLGVLLAGAAYVPLDPQLPAQRLSYMAEDADLAMCVTERGLASQLPPTAGQLIVLDDVFAGPHPPAPSAASRRHDDRSGEDLAYILYTSGSTGRPKGVEIPHRAVVNFLQGMATQPGLGPNDRVLAVTTLSFDISVLELLLPLVVGARTVIVDKDISTDATRLAAVVTSEAITCMQATPSTYRILLASLKTRQPHLRVLCGGESFPRDLLRPLLALCGEVWNMYGPTETTVWSTVARLTDAEAPIAIGLPVANTTAFVLDAWLQSVPRGVIGELYLGGRGLALGYHGRPDLTAERFLDDPPARTRPDAIGVPRERIYRTGDLARVRPDGALECLGRADDQVKLRGYRIELGEIEAVLQSVPLIRQAAVRVVERSAGPELVGYYVADEDVPSQRILEVLGHTLPVYMVPRRYLRLEAIPLGASGKVDRRRLPVPEVDLDEADTEHKSPTNDLEVRLLALWTDVLKNPSLGIEDDFFAAGGNSLAAIVLVRRMSTEIAHDIDLRLLFEHSTVQRLARAVGDHQRGEQRSVVTLQTGEAPTPVFYLAGIHLYLDLARSLPGCTSYGVFLQDEVEVDSELLADLRSEDTARLARRYVQAIREVRPHGPYALGGICFGGVLAFECARLLEAEGETISLLVLMETALKSSRLFRAGSLVREGWSRLQSEGAWVLASRLVRRSGPTKNAPAAPVDASARLAQARDERLSRAMMQFHPVGRVHPTRTAIIRARDERLPAGYVTEPTGGMGAFIDGPWRQLSIPGDHLEILHPPHVSALAAALAPSLREAEALPADVDDCRP